MRAVRSKPSAASYPEADDMGEHELQRLIAELLRPLLARFLAERHVVAHVGADQFVYWAEGQPTKRVAPDIYVLPRVRQDIVIRAWKTWETGIVPSFVLEVASDDFGKDYDDNPALYGELGVDELVVFDPHARPGSRSRRVRWQLFRRMPRRGLVRVAVSQGDRVGSKHLGAWLVAVGSGDDVRIRVGVGPDGDELYPTEVEAERAGRAAERAGRLAAETEVERLRRLLERHGRSKRAPKKPTT